MNELSKLRLNANGVSREHDVKLIGCSEEAKAVAQAIIKAGELIAQAIEHSFREAPSTGAPNALNHLADSLRRVAVSVESATGVNQEHP